MGTIATTRVYRNNPPLNTGEGLTILRNNQIALRELIGSLPPATITSVSSNTITPTSTMLIINVNATINTITSTVNLSGETTTDNAQAEQEFHDGAVIKIIATSGKTVTIGNSGNIQLLNNASSVTVSSTTPTVLIYNATTHKWVEHERVSELIGGVVGDLSSLTTTAKNSVVAAINEVDSNTNTNATNHTTLLNAVGDITKSGNNISAISSQITRTSIIAAINDIVSKIGLPLSGLTTSVKSSIVAAINSLVSGKADKTEVGTLADLTTTAKTSTVAAINELKSTYDTEIGDLTNLSTTNKDSVVSAINELNTGVVHTSGDETVAGNKTFSGTVDLTRTTDAGGTSTNKPALRIGSLSGKHLEFDGDEIMAKNTGNTVGQLNVNLDGGLVKIGNGGLTVTGTITGNVTGDLTGTASNATNDVDGNAIKTTYAKLASPTFTGTPKAPTASASTNNTQIATTAFVKTAISNLVSSAPTTLDTLNEIATALGNDPNFATTIVGQIAAKADDSAVVHKTGDETIGGKKTINSPLIKSGGGGACVSDVTNGSLYMLAGSQAADGGGIWLYGKDNSSAGRVRLQARKDAYYQLDLNGDGTLRLNGLSFACKTDNSALLGTDSLRWKEAYIVRLFGDVTGDLTGNAATATKATQDENGRNIASGYMWRNSYERIAGTSTAHKDLNDYTNAGFYNIATQYVDNVPAGIGTYAVLLVYPWKPTAGNGTLYSSQEITEAYSSANCRRWIRKQNNGVWSEWKQLAFDDEVVHTTYWRSMALNRSIAEAITATSTAPYTLTTTDFGSDYKEILFKFVHTSAQSAAATFKLKVYFSDNNTALAQINNFLSTAANNYLHLKIINNFGLAECYSMRATKGSLGAWNSLTGDTGSVLPVLVDPDATITKVELYSSTSSVTQIPSGFSMYSWGRK